MWGVSMCNINVIFKMDDLTGLSENVCRLDELVQKNKLKISWGIIGNSLEVSDDAYFYWIKEKYVSGQYEFWNHGYTHASDPYEFLGQSEKLQLDHIEKTQTLGLQRLGIVFRAFGAPANKIDENTAEALKKVTDIKVWLYGLPEYGIDVFPRYVNMEVPVGVPSLSRLQTDWAKLSEKQKKMVVLQAHPNMWNDGGFQEFEKIVKFLKSERVNFVLPSYFYGRKKAPKIVIVSGFGQSGNSAVRDFLKEFDNVYVKENEDFLIKYAGGLADLRTTFVYNNNWYTCDNAIKEFLKLAFWYNRYENIQKSEFLFKTEAFIANLCEYVFSVEEDPFNWWKYSNLPYKNRVFVAKKLTLAEFNTYCSEYLDSVFSAMTDKEYIVLVNSLANSQIVETINLFSDARVITCARDLRDVYVDFKLNAQGSFVPAASGQNVKIYFEAVYDKYPVSHERVLNIKFEDLVLSYEQVSKEIMNFLGLEPDQHIKTKLYFNPENSKKNIGLYKSYLFDKTVRDLEEFQNVIFYKK